MQRTGNTWRRRIILIVVATVIAGLTIAADLFTKGIFERIDAGSDGRLNIVVIPDFFYFTYTENTGAAFSFLADAAWGQTFFKVLTCVALVAFVCFLVYAVKKGYAWLTVKLAFIIGGTVGNFADRIVLGKVRDFIGFIFGSYYFPIFNLADTFLTVGTIMFIVYFLFISKNALFNFRQQDGKKAFDDDNNEKGDDDNDENPSDKNGAI